jgi:hypothetical protein
MNSVLLCAWATDWTIGVLGFDFRRALGVFLFTTASRTVLGPTQPPIQWVPGTLSLGVKRPGREADHSSPSSAEVRMRGAISPLSQYVSMAWCLAKHRDNFTLTFHCYVLHVLSLHVVSATTQFAFHFRNVAIATPAHTA